VDIPPVRFGVLNFIGTTIYIVVLSSIGYSLGGAWSKLNHSLSLASYVLVAVVVLAIVGFVLVRLREFRRESAAGGSVAGSPTPPERAGRHRQG
jgi:membrane protein DedA with SNARE-associated domain